MFVVAPMAGALAYRVGNRPVLAGGLGLQAAGLAWIAVIAAPDVGYGALVLPLVLNGIGVSMAIPVVQSAILGAVAPHEVGKASGANNMTQELGGVFGVAILVAVFTTVGSFASPVAFIDGFTIAMIVCAALAGGGAIIALAVPRPESTPSQLIPLPIDAEEYPLESGEGDHARHRGSGGDQHR
ncbi:MAG: MFS transporter [Pseudonocardiaceae bacterium]